MYCCLCFVHDESEAIIQQKAFFCNLWLNAPQVRSYVKRKENIRTVVVVMNASSLNGKGCFDTVLSLWS